MGESTIDKYPEVFSLCDNRECCKEFALTFEEGTLEWICVFNPCEHCGHTNRVWLRIPKEPRSYHEDEDEDEIPSTPEQREEESKKIISELKEEYEKTEYWRIFRRLELSKYIKIAKEIQKQQRNKS